MTLPTVVGVGTVANGTGDVVPGLPIGWAENDILVMPVEQSAVNTFGSAPSGWALVTNTQQKAGSAADDGNLQVYWKRATSSESAPTVTDTINHTSARIIAVRGCITSGNPWDVTTGGTSAAGTAVTITGGTTTVNDCLILSIVGTGSDIASTTEIGSWANASQANVTERMDNWHTDGNGGGFGMASGEKATAGAYGNTTATLVTSSTQAWCTIALKPGGTVNNKSVDGAMTPGGAIAKTDNKTVSGAVSSIVGTNAKQGNKVLSGALSSIVGSLAKQTNKVLAGAVSTIAGALVGSHVFNVDLSGALSSIVGTLTNQGQKTLTGAVSTISGAITKQTSKVLSGSASSITGALTKQGNKVLTGALSSITGTLTGIKTALVSLSGGMTPSGTLNRQSSKSFAGSLSTITGTLVRQGNKSLAGDTASSGSLSRLIGKAVSGTLATAGALSRSISKTFSGALSSIVGSLATQFNQGGVQDTSYSLGGLVYASSRGTLRQRAGSVVSGIRRVIRAKARQ